MKTSLRVNLKHFLIGVVIAASGSVFYAVAAVNFSDFNSGSTISSSEMNSKLNFLKKAVNDTEFSFPVVMWINHLDFLPGDSSVQTSFRAVSSDVGGLTGLNIASTTTGEVGAGGGNKVIEKGLQIPPLPTGVNVSGVRVCYELSNVRTYISQIRLAQIQDPPSSAVVGLDDGTDQLTKGPVCVDSSSTSINPSSGALLLSLRVNFGDVTDKIVVRAVGLHLSR